MKQQMIYLRNRIFSYWFIFGEWLDKTIGPHLPLISRRKPRPPDLKCSLCDKPLNKIIAIDTGDGWCFYWDCEDNCGYSEEYIENWYPFLWGAWCKSKDLERIGIEVY